MQSSTARPSPRMRDDELTDVARAFGIESGSRLVEQHDARSMNDRARQRDALLQSFRQARRPVICSGREISKSASASFTAFSASRQPIEPRVDLEVVADRQVVPQARAPR